MLSQLQQQRNQMLGVRAALVEGFMRKSILSLVIIAGSAGELCAEPHAASAHAGHQHKAKPAVAQPMSAEEHEAMGHTGGHAGMDHSKHQPAATAETQAAPAHDMAAMDHGSHSMATMQGGNAPADARDANAYNDGYGFGDLHPPHMGDQEVFAMLIVDRLENAAAAGDNVVNYDWQAWLGKTYDRLVVRAEGEIDTGSFLNARNEVLWGHALSPYWDSQLGMRYDAGMKTERGWFAAGLQGFAPYWLYVEATAYVGEEGRTAFRLETEYDLLLSQSWILQPRMETNFYGKRDDSRLVSSGLSDFEAGLRLRYEIRREFAPYIGVEWAGTFGSAADLLKAAGTSPEQLRFVAGVHFWF
jgi:copper resistance protein B